MKTQIQLHLLAGLLFGAAALLPAPAQQMNYQGRLTDANGNPLVDGQYTLTFSLWTATSGGTKSWGPFITDGGGGDGHSAKADVVNGRFNVILGPNDTNGVSLVNGFGGSTRYLQIQVEANPPISPRQQVLAAPEALHAIEADHAATATAVGTPGSASAINILNGNVGIGTATPATKLEVNGDVTVNGSVMATIFNGSGAGLTAGSVSLTSLMEAVQQALCPPGTIVAFGGTNIPSGWLLCDGRPLTNAVYTNLFAAIGTNWGNGTLDSNGATNQGTGFNLPDLRGMFLRGVSGTLTNAAWKDPEATSRTNRYAGNTGNKVGSIQPDGFRSHNHTWLYGTQGDDSGSGGSYAEYTRIPGSDVTAIASTGGTETRPINAYVNYIIKY